MAFLRIHRWFAPVMALLLCACALCVRAQTQSPPSQPETPIPEAAEYAIKGAYLYNLALFTRWPANAFTNANAPLTICILGEDPFGSALDTILEKERANGRKIAIVRAISGEQIPPCHLLFVSSSERRQFAEVLAAVKGKPILTIADQEPFVRLGGCVRFRRDGRKIRLVINPTVVRESGLRMDSELLRIATLVETEPK